MKKYIFTLIALLAMSIMSMNAQIMRIYNGETLVKEYKSSEATRVVFVEEHSYVDLGLPSGTLWATTNVGASSPEEAGNWYAWGETEPKDSYTTSTYKYYSNNSYTSLGDDISGTQYDAATVNWGSEWMMPNYTQTKELIDNTTQTNETVNGQSVLKVVGPNGNYIIIPDMGKAEGINGGFAFWTSTSSGSSFARRQYEWSSISSSWRYQPFPVRPIHLKVQATALNAGDKVEGTTTINGTTYTKAVGGTVADYVDLGITVDGKKVLWATHNLGATNPEDYGAYIAWGDKGVSEEGYSDGIKLKSGNSYYDWDNNAYNGTSSWTGYNKYTIADNQTSGSWYTDGTFTGDNKTTLESQDDAATVNWGSDWRTPTYNEWVALNNTDNFTWTWDATNNGYTVTSKISGYEGKSIFLPAAGCRLSSNLYSTGSRGYYWSSSLHPNYSYDARLCFFSSGYHNTDDNSSRFHGRSVRPVRVQN